MDVSTPRLVVFGSCLSLVCACTGETSAGEHAGGSGGSMNAMAGASGSAGAAGSGTLPSGGSGGAGTLADSGAPGGSGGSGQAGAPSNPNCPEKRPQPVAGQTVVISAVWITQRVIYVKNVSSSDVEITYPSWQWCALPAYGRLVTANKTLAPGEELSVAGLDGFSGEVSGAEIAVYDNTAFNDPTAMRAYVAWNERLEQGRENIASEAGLWTYLDRAVVDPGDVGLFATGPTDQGSGYTSVPVECFR